MPSGSAKSADLRKHKDASLLTMTTKRTEFAENFAEHATLD